MTKYINSEKFRIIISKGEDLISIKPGEGFESKALIPELAKYLVDDTPPSEDYRAKTPGRVPTRKKARGKTDGSKA